jgi:hypothetical protein
MTGNMPKENELINFIVQTHQLDHVPLSPAEVNATLKIGRGLTLSEGDKPVTNPYAVGHFKAFTFMFQNLIGSVDFPCKSSQTLINQYHSDTSLWWLRELHTTIMYPVALWGQQTGDMNAPKTYECGVYRCRPRQLAFTNAPEPEQIQPLLHLWLLDIATFHEEIKGKITNPYGLTRTEAEQLYHKPIEAQLFLSCLQPFEDGNNRIARLVENALRLQWGLPWKQPREDGDAITRLGQYQTNGFSKWLRALKSM